MRDPPSKNEQISDSPYKILHTNVSEHVSIYVSTIVCHCMLYSLSLYLYVIYWFIAYLSIHPSFLKFPCLHKHPTLPCPLFALPPRKTATKKHSVVQAKTVRPVRSLLIAGFFNTCLGKTEYLFKGCWRLSGFIKAVFPFKVTLATYPWWKWTFQRPWQLSSPNRFPPFPPTPPVCHQDVMVDTWRFVKKTMMKTKGKDVLVWKVLGSHGPTTKNCWWKNSCTH